MKYDAFISYRHLEKDMYVAKKIHKTLESLKLPRNIRKLTGRKRINRVFRDQEELPIGSDLGNNIYGALMESEYLIVICSPETKNSYWVMQEINTFIAMHGRQNILAVLVEGEPDQSFPPQLLVNDYGYRVEPLAADVRGKNKKEIRSKIASEAVRLAAAIIGVDYDELRQRRREGKVRRNFAIAAALAVVGISFGAYNAYNLARINENYQQKLINESKVLSEKSLEVLESGDRQTAALLAMEALPSEDNDRVFVPEAMYALSDALGSYNNGEEFFLDRYFTANVEIKESFTDYLNGYLVIVDKDNRLYCYNVESGKLLFEKEPEYIDGEVDPINTVSVNKKEIICVLTDNYIVGYNAKGDEVYKVYYGEKNILADYEYSIGGDHLTTINYCYLDGFKNVIRYYDTETGELLNEFESSELFSVVGLIIRYDGKREHVAISHGGSLGANPLVSVFDVNTGEEKIIEAKKDAVKEVRFTSDDNLLVVSMDDEDNNIALAFTPTIYVQYFDLETGDVVWEKEFVYDTYGEKLSGIIVRNSDDGSQFIMACGRTLYTLDSSNGEVLGSFRTDEEIVDFSAWSDAMGIVCSTKGTVSCINRKLGIVYHSIRLPESVKNFYTYNTYMTAMASDGSKIYGITYHKDQTMTQIDQFSDFPNTILEVDGSDYYVINATTSIFGDESNIHIYDYDRKAEIGSFFVSAKMEDSDEIGEKSYQISRQLSMDNGIKYAIFDDDTIVAINGIDTLYYYSVRKKELKTYPYEFSYVSKLYPADTGKYLLSIFPGGYKVLDMTTRKEKYSGTIPEDCINAKQRDAYGIMSVVVSGNQKYAYFVNEYMQLYRIDLAAGQTQKIFSEYAVKDIALSEDDKTIALMCNDGTIRIANEETFIELHSIDYYASADYYFSFIDNDKYFACLGDDRYLKIYDLTKKELVYISSEEVETIADVKFYKEENMMVFTGNQKMYLIDIDNMGILFTVDDGKIYNPEKGVIVSCTLQNLCQFNIKTLDDLKAEFTQQFGDAQLTEEQRLMFKID